jgi:hypothetical protein
MRLDDHLEQCLVCLITQSPVANRGPLPFGAEFHIGRVGDAGDNNAPHQKQSTTQNKHQRICSRIGQPPRFERRLVLLHGNKGRRDAGRLVATLACQGGTGYNEDTKRKHACVSGFKGRALVFHSRRNLKRSDGIIVYFHIAELVRMYDSKALVWICACLGFSRKLDL